MRAEKWSGRIEEENRQKELEKKKNEALKEKKGTEARKKKEIEREGQKRLKEEWEMGEKKRLGSEEEERREIERKKRDKNENDIIESKNDQYIAEFLELIKRFSDDCSYMRKTLEDIDEGKLRLGNKNYSIYLDILEKFGDVDYIKQKIIELSIKNLDLSSIIDLIKKFKDEKQKIMFFNSIDKNVISYQDFIEFNPADKIKLLTELMKNKLIPESFYLDKNKNELNIIYNKLTSYDEKKYIYLNTIVNENEGIQKIYCKRFELFKLIKGDKYDFESEFNKKNKRNSIISHNI